MNEALQRSKGLYVTTWKVGLLWYTGTFWPGALSCGTNDSWLTAEIELVFVGWWNLSPKPWFFFSFLLMPFTASMCGSVAAGKVTVGLASHWPRVTDISGSPPTGSRSRRGRWAPAYALMWSMVDSILPLLHWRSWLGDSKGFQSVAEFASTISKVNGHSFFLRDFGQHGISWSAVEKKAELVVHYWVGYNTV